MCSGPFVAKTVVFVQVVFVDMVKLPFWFVALLLRQQELAFL